MAETSPDAKLLKKISDAFKELADIVNSQSSDVEVASFSWASSLVSPLIGCLGIAFKFAEMDYVAKANTVRKVGSHTRNLLRVKRGLDLVRVLFDQILVTDGNSLKDPVSKAYAEVFAPHHGWAIRKAVAAGMYTLPTKQQVLRRLNEDAKCRLKYAFTSVKFKSRKGI